MIATFDLSKKRCSAPVVKINSKTVLVGPIRSKKIRNYKGALVFRGGTWVYKDLYNTVKEERMIKRHIVKHAVTYQERNEDE